MDAMDTDKTNTDAICAKGDAVKYVQGVWVCHGCGKRLLRSPNQHIYAARKRVAARKSLDCNCGEVGPVQCDMHGPRE